MESTEEKDVLDSGMSRRTFVQAAGATAVVGVAAASLAGCTTDTEEESTVDPVDAVVTTELDIPIEAEPTTTSYECDVLVVGGGWAGVSACRRLAEDGHSVVLADKAYPGWSGLSAWSNSFHWFDDDYDNRDLELAAWRRNTDYSANLNWIKLWMDHSKEVYSRTEAWGALEQFPNTVNADPDYNYSAAGDVKGYYQDYVGIGVGGRCRHWAFAPAIQEVAEMVPYTMITNVIVDGGRVVGAVGFNVRSATVISFACKAVIMCSGPGSFKPNGYPTGSSTWDGDYIGYNLGLQIGGKEWSDFHSTSNADTGNVYMQWIGHHVQCNWPTIDTGVLNTWYGLWSPGVADLASIDGVAQYDPYPSVEEESSSTGPASATAAAAVTTASATAVEEEEDDGDIRGSDNAVGFSNLGLGSTRVCGQPCAGLSIHKAEGVYTGNEATTATSIPGLYYAGDALSSSSMGGNYFGMGFSSCQSATQGYYAGVEATSYVASAAPGYITDAVLAEETETILAPVNLSKGFDPCWLRDYLTVIMSTANVSTWKTPDQLNAALTMVEYMRDVYVPKLAAIGGHELRMCHEMKSKVLNAEMRLRVCLAREESRGRHYRADFPYRDDENFLCQMIVSKDASGEMQIEKIPYDDEWCGDTTQDYVTRYILRFPGEADAVGFEDPGLSSSEMTALANELIAEEIA